MRKTTHEPAAVYAHHCGKVHPCGICSVKVFASLIRINPELSQSIAAVIRLPKLAIYSTVQPSSNFWTVLVVPSGLSVGTVATSFLSFLEAETRSRKYSNNALEKNLFSTQKIQLWGDLLAEMSKCEQNTYLPSPSTVLSGPIYSVQAKSVSKNLKEEKRNQEPHGKVDRMAQIRS